ncbi:PAS domain S-box protein [Fodinibius sediminis]|uniref:PAS domain S-box-containing protein n=1 Tax=Fodinibius sediminis TaxID=1214077 RepID=A0A521CN04_9BACT|nr:PAS domain S-box protein [Fodinibius sediminis]SMO60834.1 PAS domain S-box-containing protein [Fodinibius sediminis]
MCTGSFPWPVGKGTMAEQFRGHAWSETSLGSISQWPEKLKATVDIILHADTPRAVFWGTDFTFLYNDRWTDLLGDKHPSILGTSLEKTQPALWEKIKSELKATRETGAPRELKNLQLPVGREQDDDTALFNLRFTPVFSGTGTVAGIISKAALAPINQEFDQLYESSSFQDEKARLRLLAQVVQNSPHFIRVSDTEGNPLFINESALQLIGMDWQEAQKTPVHEFFVEEEREYVEQHVLKSVVENGSWSGELHFQHAKTGNKIPVLYSIFRIDDPQTGTPTHFATITRDLTKQKGTEHKLRKSEELYKSLFESMDEGFFLLDMLYDVSGRPVDFRFAEVNPAFSAHSGLDAGDVAGKRVKEVLPDIEDYWIEQYGEVARTGEPVRFTDYSQPLERIFDVNAFPIAPPSDHRVAVLFKDVTEQVKTKQKLQQHKNRLQTALEIDTVGVLFWGPRYTLTETNQAFLQMSGFGYEEAIGKSWKEFTPDEYYTKSEKAIAELNDTGSTDAYEKEYYRKDGSRWWGLFAPRRINEDEVVEYVVDITERKHREEREHFLLELNDTLRPLYNPDKILEEAMQLLGDYLDVNRVIYLNNKDEDQKFIIKSDYTSGVSSIAGEHLSDKFGTSMWNQLKSGNTYVANNIPDDPALSGKVKKNYNKIETAAKVGVPLVKNDKLVAILAVHQAEAREWTEQEMAIVEETAERTWAYVERSKAEQQLIELKNTLEDRVKKRTRALKSYQKKLQSLTTRLNKTEEHERQRLASELHDNLGQMLTLGKISLQNIQTEDLSGEASDEIATATGIVDEALNYTRELMTELKPPPGSEQEGIKDSLEWVANKMEKNEMEVMLSYDDEKMPLTDEVQTFVYQSVRELLFNVLKHAGVKKARVNVSRQEKNIRVSVEDEGTGFEIGANDPEPDANGGFGLFNIRERMDWIGGDFEIHSEPGTGTRAVIYAPLKKDQPDAAALQGNELTPPAEPEAPPVHSEKIDILLVDDHDMVRRGLRNLIEVQDELIIIAEAGNGREAVDLTRELQPDIVIMDVNMPVMNGIEATEILSEEYPEVQVIGLSLHDQKEVSHKMQRAGASAYLTKDEAFETLTGTIRNIFQADRS